MICFGTDNNDFRVLKVEHGKLMFSVSYEIGGTFMACEMAQFKFKHILDNFPQFLVVVIALAIFAVFIKQN